MKVSPKQFDAICRELSDRVRGLGLAALQSHGYWGLDPRAEGVPASYGELVDSVSLAADIRRSTPSSARARLFPVWNGGCEDTIYSTPLDNMLFRAWHDLNGHVDMGLTLSIRHEKTLAHRHSLLFGGALREIFLADTTGQTEYLEATGGFPLLQRQYVYDYVTRGRVAAIDAHFKFCSALPA